MIEVDDVVESALALEPLPESLVRIAELVGEDETDMSAVGDVVARDPALCARVLRVANSSTGGAISEITSPHQATVRLGPARILSLVMANEVRGKLDVSLRPYRMRKGELWEHAVGASIAAEELERFAAAPISPAAVTAALLHDIGKIVLAQHLDAETIWMLRRACREGCSTGMDAEVEVLGLTHAELGGLIGRHWDLPASIVEAMTHHHDPTTAPEAYRVDAAVVFVADMIAKLALAGVDRNWFSVDDVRTAMETLGLDKEALRPLCERVRERHAVEMQAYK